MFYNEDNSKVERLLIKQQQNKITPEETADLEQLMKENPDAKEMAEYYKNDPLGKIAMPDDAEVAAIWEKLEARMLRPSRKVVPMRKLLIAAATILLIVSTASYFILRPQSDKDILKNDATASGVLLHMDGDKTVQLSGAEQHIKKGVIASATKMNIHGAAAGMNTIEVPKKLDYQLRLADGTEVKLNASTTLKFPFTFDGDKREVYVDGEAYFNIAADAKHPFIVHTAKGDVTVLGTEFNVNTYNEDVLKTSLVKGAVNVGNAEQSYLLKPGQEITFGAGTHTIAPMDERATLSWMQGVLYFHNTPLAEIAEMIERWYGVEVVIDDPKLAKEPFTGNMEKAQPLEELLVPMKGVVNMRCYYKGDVLHMTR